MSTELAIIELSPSPPISRKVAPNRRGITRESMRPREYLTAEEVNTLSDAAKNSRNPIRDEAIILLGFRHGLRAAEIVSLKWAMVDLKAGILHVRRVKGGTPSTHPLRGPELRVLNQIRSDQESSFHSAEQLAAYLGLTPVESSSGSSVFGRPHLSKSGPSNVRAILYMAAIVAIRYNKHIKDLYERLLAKGKSKMSALGAAMRKLVHLCFGVLKT